MKESAAWPKRSMEKRTHILPAQLREGLVKKGIAHGKETNNNGRQPPINDDGTLGCYLSHMGIRYLR